ncbi:MAG: DMT family transporter [Actinomycetota bacterium]|nr:DMT family transporter [Actinomycetota bacterium]
MGKSIFIVILSVCASVLFNYALFLQKRAVDKLPDVKFQISWTVFVAFVTNGLWLLSVILTIVGGVMYSVAITLAPISIVQPILGVGVALLAYLAIKNLGEKPRRSDLVAIGISILGVILIGVSLAEGIPENIKHSPVSLWIFAGVVGLLTIIFPLAMLKGSRNRQSVGLGISVGLLYGLGAIFGRLLLVDWTHRWSSAGPMVFFKSVFLIAWLLTFVPAFIMLQAALQRGLAVVVSPIMTGLSQLIPILGGMIALNEPLPKSAALSVLRCIAFCLIILATMILSRRAEETG